MRMILGETEWPFLETSTTINSIVSQQFYDLPYNYDKLIDVTYTIGTVVFRPIEVTSRKRWDEINNTTAITASPPQFYFIYNNQIGFWPIPASVNTITLNFKKIVRDQSVADYTTGSITDVTNGSTSVTGTGCSWTAQMIGRYIRIDYANGVKTGDGYWYQIAAVPSSTTLTLDSAYQGLTFTGGNASYTIGQVMVIPEKYQRGPVYYAASNFWAKEMQDNGRSKKFMDLFEQMRVQMLEEYANKTTDPTVDDGRDFTYVNPNLTIWAS